MGGLIGAVARFLRGTRDGTPIAEVVLDPGGGANVTADHFGPAGDDSKPLEGDNVATVESSGRQHAVGYHDPKNAGVADYGEVRRYARDPSDGSIVAYWFLHNDGLFELVVVKEGADLKLSTAASGGEIDLNGVKIDKDGKITAAAITVNGVELGGHMHAESGTNTGPPLAGAP